MGVANVDRKDGQASFPGSRPGQHGKEGISVGAMTRFQPFAVVLSSWVISSGSCSYFEWGGGGICVPSIFLMLLLVPICGCAVMCA